MLVWIERKKRFPICTLFFYDMNEMNKILKNLIAQKNTRFLDIVSLKNIYIFDSCKEACCTLYLKYFTNVHLYLSIMWDRPYMKMLKNSNAHIIVKFGDP